MFGSLIVVASPIVLTLESSANCDVPFVAILLDEADIDKLDSSVLLLLCGDRGRSAVAAMFCCDLTMDDSMLVKDVDSLE